MPSLTKSLPPAMQVAITMGFALLFGVLFVVIALLGKGTVANGLLWAAAWSAVGWFLGFIFGIPRFLSTDTARTPAAQALDSAQKKVDQAAAAAKASRDAASQAAAEAAKNPQDAALAAAAAAAEDKAKADEATLQKAQADFAAVAAKPAGSSGSSVSVNTNLEQISDWLTKIIVGVSLVESQTLLTKMQGAATYMAHSMAGEQALAAARAAAVAAPAGADTAASGAALVVASAASAAMPAGAAAGRAAQSVLASAESLAFAVMLYFLVSGLLGSYLLTRLFLQDALAKAAAQDNGGTAN